MQYGPVYIDYTKSLRNGIHEILRFILYCKPLFFSVYLFLLYFLADWRFAINGQQINRRQSINGNLESIGCKSGLQICRIPSLLCYNTFRVSLHRIVYLTEPSCDNVYTNDTIFINYWKPSHNFIITIKILYINRNLHTAI